MAPEEGSTDLASDIEDIRRYLRDQPLEFALLFGSQVTGTATDRSDVDLVVKLSDDLEPDERFQRRNRIAGELMALLGRDDVDVSELDHLPTEIAHSALQEGVLLVGDEETVADYRQQVAKAYEQTATDRKRDRDALLRRLEQGTYGR
ncbi:nucleotidyltransferase domain-containing protein [Salinirubellus sp. GCM10025818]|uniref:type VII toxin-antitoxin system MntA family adenylyltransferase antitoxin n=1 Tax=Salinirubellus TaxID=2162630 RepID=UPI0030D57BD8